MHRDSRRITRTGTTNVVTASCHTVFPPRLIELYPPLLFPLNVLNFKNWRETCKPCDVIKSKWPRERMSPMIVCVCEGRRRKVKVRWKNLQ